MNQPLFQRLITFPRIPKFANEQFNKHFIQADKVMLVLLVLHWVVATFITSMSYDTYWYGFISGGMITLPLLAFYPSFKGTQTMRALIAVGLMLFSLVFIQQHLGRIEMHFHVFIALGILTLYKDVVPIFVVAATTILHHSIFNYLQTYEIALFRASCKFPNAPSNLSYLEV